MRSLFLKIYFVFGLIALYAGFAPAMDEYSGLATYERSSFWNLESGQFGLLEKNLPIMVHAAHFIDSTELENQLAKRFKIKQTLSNDEIYYISKKIVKYNVWTITGWTGFIMINFAYTGITNMIEYYWIRAALENSQYLVDVLTILSYYFNKYKENIQQNNANL